MISYLDIDFSGEPIGNYNIADLFDLVRFALITVGLQIEDLHDTFTTEDVVATFDPLCES
jgi:hypothetical protein